MRRKFEWAVEKEFRRGSRKHGALVSRVVGFQLIEDRVRKFGDVPMADPAEDWRRLVQVAALCRRYATDFFRGRRARSRLGR